MSTKKVTATIAEEIKPKKHKEFLPYRFTEEEMKKISKRLAQSTTDLVNLKNEKKSIMAQYASKISGKEADIAVLANNTNSGFEYRQIDVITEYNNPKIGWCRTTRVDTDEEVGIREMTAEELQMKLDMQEEEELLEEED